MWSQYAGDVVNSILLISIFLYQYNKNKLLLQRIDQQKEIISETKEIVVQQSTAIESQGRVVDAAVKYSETFSVDRVESIIRRELEIEQKVERVKTEDEYKKARQEIERDYRDRLAQKDALIKVFDKNADKSIALAKEFSEDYITPLMTGFVSALYPLSPEVRLVLTGRMGDGPAKEMVLNVMEKIDSAKSVASTVQFGKET